MEEKEFWEIIDLLDWDCEGDDEAVVEPVVERLAALSDEDIFAFDDALAAHLYALDRRDIASAAFGDEGYFSPDEFVDWRCVCVVNGEELYRDALEGRDLPSSDLCFESILYVAAQAWERKHGAPQGSYPHEAEPDYFTYSNEQGWADAE